MNMTLRNLNDLVSLDLLYDCLEGKENAVDGRSPQAGC